MRKNPSVNIWVPKMRFPKMYIFWAPIWKLEIGKWKLENKNYRLLKIQPPYWGIISSRRPLWAKVLTKVILPGWRTERRTDWWTIELTDEKTDGWMDWRTNGLTDERTDGRTDWWKNRLMDKRTDRRTDWWTIGRTDNGFKGVR